MATGGYEMTKLNTLKLFFLTLCIVIICGCASNVMSPVSLSVLRVWILLTFTW